MAIVDRVDGNLSGKWDDVANKWIEPPKESLAELPEALPVNILALAAQNLLAYRVEIDAWLKASPVVQSLFATESRTLSYNELEAFKGIIANDRDDVDNPMTTDLATGLLTLVGELQTQVKNPNV